MPNTYSRPVDPSYPQRPPGSDAEIVHRRNTVARLPPNERANSLLKENLYHDRDGYIYCLQRWVFDWNTGLWHSQIKYGLTDNLQRRMRQYKKCGAINWLYCWPTSCVKLTEALIHARLRSRGLGVEDFFCWCGHWHHEFFWAFGIADVCREVEEVLVDTAQPITSKTPVAAD
ncbi:hypothetical protein R3P38DRAFT_3235312 [Favolaschia claudopus]|uniref:Bacteriophage T5 Orf172 DNA-binding domain-containing protein n=1 Tax=Favolaschia claudopus TaxID=2862362 RepID=A0AAV9ZEV9_9AGAR